jgi:hypothetical protein
MVDEFGDEEAGVYVAPGFASGGRAGLVPLVEEEPEAVDDFVVETLLGPKLVECLSRDGYGFDAEQDVGFGSWVWVGEVFLY